MVGRDFGALKWKSFWQIDRIDDDDDDVDKGATIHSAKKVRAADHVTRRPLAVC